MKFIAFLIGVGTGAAAAVLFAPRSGDETREMLYDKMQEGRKVARKRAREFQSMAADRAKDLRDAATDMAADAADQGREVINRHKDALGAAATAAKETWMRESGIS